MFSEHPKDKKIPLWMVFIVFLKDFIYLFMRDTERERLRHSQREKKAPRGETDAGLDLRIPGS